MKTPVSRVSLVASLLLLSAGPGLAGELPLARLGDVGGSSITPVAFGDGPATGPHHARRSHAGETQKSVDPSHADMHGATREDADKAYRKQYGF